MTKKIFRLYFVILLVTLSICTLVACGETGTPIQIHFYVDCEEYSVLDTTQEKIAMMQIKMPDDPTKIDYEFDGWYWDSGVWSEPFTANSINDRPLSSNMKYELHAKFNRVSPYKVIFKSYDDSVFATINTFGQEMITLPQTEPTRSGYVFDKWVKSNGDEFSANSLLNTTLSEDCIIYATWLEKFNITYSLPVGATHTNPSCYIDGTSVTLTAPIVQEGRFIEWQDEEGNKVTSLPIDGEYRNVTLTAIVNDNVILIGAQNGGYGVEWLKKTVEEFNSMQDEHVAVMYDCDSPNFNSKAEQQLKDPATAENDIYLISEIWWKQNAKNLYFKSLDEVYCAMFNDDMTIEEAMLSNNLAKAKVIDKNGEEHYYAINYETTSSGLIYNKTIGDYYESLPQWGSTPKMAKINDGGTVDQLIQWMDKISELSKTYYAFGDGEHYLDGTTVINTEGGTFPAVYPMVYAGTHSYWDAVLNTWWAQAAGVDGYRRFYNYESPAVYADTARLRALKALEKLDVNNNCVIGSVLMTPIESQNEFLRGRAAIIPCGDWMYYESRNSADTWGTDFEMIYVPACDDQVPQNQRKIITSSAGGLCVIPNNDRVNYEGAIEFLKYLFSEQGCINYTSETGSLWGFDGYEGEETYASILKEGGLFSPFSERVFDLRQGANGYVVNLPLDPSGVNVAFSTTSGVGGEWPGQNLSRIREGVKTAEEVFYGCINYVGQETADHSSDSEWDRWWNIVKVG